MEHRWGERLPMELEVTVSIPGGASIAGTVVDISLSGAFVRLPAGLRDLSVVHIEFTGLPFADRVPLRAQVVRSTEVGVGLEWDGRAAAAVRGILLLHAQAVPDGSWRTPLPRPVSIMVGNRAP